MWVMSCQRGPMALHCEGHRWSPAWHGSASGGVRYWGVAQCCSSLAVLLNLNLPYCLWWMKPLHRSTWGMATCTSTVQAFPSAFSGPHPGACRPAACAGSARPPGQRVARYRPRSKALLSQGCRHAAG